MNNYTIRASTKTHYVDPTTLTLKNLNYIHIA